MRGQKYHVLIVLLLGLFLSARTVLGNGSTELVRSVFSGGGSTIESGNTSIHSTIGQPVAGRISSTNREVCSGFPCQPQATQTPTPTSTATATPTATAISTVTPAATPATTVTATPIGIDIYLPNVLGN